MSPPLSQSSDEQPTGSIGMEWPEFDTAWEIVKSATEERARQCIAQSDAPDIADKMDWVLVEDPESLEGVSREELKRRFRHWARAENSGWNIDEEKGSRGSRYSLFIQVDEPSLLSIATGSDSYQAEKGGTGGSYVKIVRGWDDAVGSEAAAAEGDNDGEDWMELHMSKLNIDFYVEFDNDEVWYSFYTRPDSIYS
ncbi:hypothetical protein E0Z10_g1285 [Xylaria hypoxylon]|uniref:Uncharacterized protein n=1 Tax=Xylaria hypoxylon TaxID=37992 RepID=A0A4Z0Z907_9PEZI|nr:hypothetical protein E0Z10_g1285 [Xylaria hypoxylon]